MNGKITTRQYQFHNLLTLSVQSSHAGLLSFLDREFGEYAIASPVEQPNVRIIIDAQKPTHHEGIDRITFDDRFRRIGRMRYTIEGLDEPCTTIYVRPDWTTALYPTFAGTFIQTSVIEPIVYLKCLQWKCILMHAACLSKNGCSYLFAASGGSGKTTMALRLIQEGFAFLGDDLVFVKEDGTTLSYPRPLHLFSYVTQRLPELHLPLRLRLLLRFKDLLRAIMTATTGEKWMIATRVPIQRIVPGVRKEQTAKLDKIFLLINGRKIHRLDITTPEGRQTVARQLIGGGDINEILIAHLLERRPDLQARVLQQEQQIAQHLIEKTTSVYAINPRAFDQDDQKKLFRILSEHSKLSGDFA
jgi:hypothetical protein